LGKRKLLVKLETEIFGVYKEQLKDFNNNNKMNRNNYNNFNNNHSNNFSDNYSENFLLFNENEQNYLDINLLYPYQKRAFFDLDNFIKEKAKQNFNDKISTNLLPFGSITQFLGSSNSDLDTYLDIKTSEGFLDDKYNFIIFLYGCLKEKFKRSFNHVISNRLITFNFNYEIEKKIVKIDINFTNICGVLNSSLLKTYALYDQRFSILCIFLKKKLKDLNINFSNISKININNFSWTLILLTFLQDVINPPILPKLLSKLKKQKYLLSFKEKIKDENSSFNNSNNNTNFRSNFKENLYKENFNKNIGKVYGFYKYKLDFNGVKNFFEKNNKEIETKIPNFLEVFEDQEFLEELKAEKNEMSLSEIFLAFIEFIVFYFKFNSNFIYTSGLNYSEGFYSKSNLKKFKGFEDVNEKFHNDFLLLRDPIDKNYNPTKAVYSNNLEEIIKKLKEYYIELIQENNDNDNDK
jgi:hypothetical protein